MKTLFLVSILLTLTAQALASESLCEQEKYKAPKYDPNIGHAPELRFGFYYDPDDEGNNKDLFEFYTFPKDNPKHRYQTKEQLVCGIKKHFEQRLHECQSNKAYSNKKAEEITLLGIGTGYYYSHGAQMDKRNGQCINVLYSLRDEDIKKVKIDTSKSVAFYHLPYMTSADMAVISNEACGVFEAFARCYHAKLAHDESHREASPSIPVTDTTFERIDKKSDQ